MVFLARKLALKSKIPRTAHPERKCNKERMFSAQNDRLPIGKMRKTTTHPKALNFYNKYAQCWGWVLLVGALFERGRVRFPKIGVWSRLGENNARCVFVRNLVRISAKNRTRPFREPPPLAPERAFWHRCATRIGDDAPRPINAQASDGPFIKR